MLATLPRDEHPDLLVGTETHDDAGVYRLTPEIALIQTVDYFTPIVDDPYDFGAISAANSLSDVYAMGGIPRTAMNVVGWPQGELPWETLAAILRGGHDVVHDAGAVLVGGHSVKAPELFYGLSVTGTIHPDRVLTNAAAVEGDALFLTKPIGTGVLTTALKRGELEPDYLRGAVSSMKELNRAAAEAMQIVGVHACTDVTGFGLLGHLLELVRASRVDAEIDASSVPLLPGSFDHAKAGHKPGGLNANRRYVEPFLERSVWIDEALDDLLFDPQTSGGLLIAVAEAQAADLAQAFRNRGVLTAVQIGRVASRAGTGRIRICA